MMNILALSLVLSSLAAAGIWSPLPQREDVNVRLKQGHGVSAVEYDEGGKRNTEVSISSQPPPQQQITMKEAASSVLPNLGQGISPGGKAGHGSHFPGELICDAFGKCTKAITNVFGKAKDTVSETADETKGGVGDAFGKAIEAVAQKGQDFKESAEDSIDKVKDTMETAKDTANTIQGHAVDYGTEKMEKAREMAREEAKEAKEKTARGAKSIANKLFEGEKYKEALNRVMGIANLMGLASAYGMGLWVTFVSSNVLGEMLPRQQFGMVQSKIYPVYFKAMGFSIGLALLGHILGQRQTLFSSKPQMLQAFNLLSSFLLVLVNALYLEPKATKVMLERMKMEKEEGRGRDSFVIKESSRVSEVAMKSRESQIQSSAAATTIAKLNERLKKLNAKSSILNVVTLIALTWHLLYLAQRLGFNCC